MSTRTSGMPTGAREYMLGASLREAPVLARLRAATAPRAEAEMQIGPEQGQFMALLVRLIGAKRCIELGTYTGYSALAVALALPPDGVLVACDVSDEFTRVGRPFWREAGVESKIDLRLAPALQTLDALLAAPGGRGGYDFAFVDADKGNYIAYYEKLLELLHPGGLIAVDNTLGLSGQYITEMTTPGAQAIRAFNAHVHHDTRVDLSMLPIGEGLTLLRVL
ncbi:MAG TPA: class I SAM-dependent methyltransferase [Steroidobacteraceae bacterium]|nr:class I SAM-dependent methyltransferase [Steroidobacteraceae bacterium]